jgi:hypothetical protein
VTAKAAESQTPRPEKADGQQQIALTKSPPTPAEELNDNSKRAREGGGEG